jgi:hypothetical protein
MMVSRLLNTLSKPNHEHARAAGQGESMGSRDTQDLSAWGALYPMKGETLHNHVC